MEKIFMVTSHVVSVGEENFFDGTGIRQDQTGYYGLIKDVTNYSMNKIIKPVDFLLDGFKNSKKLALLIEPLNIKQYEFSKGYYYLIEQDSNSYQHSRDILNNIVEESAIEQIIKLADGELDEIDVTFTYNVGGDPNNQKIAELYIERFKFGKTSHSLGFLSDITEKGKNKMN